MERPSFHACLIHYVSALFLPQKVTTFLKINSCINFGLSGCSLLLAGFPWLQHAGVTPWLQSQDFTLWRLLWWSTGSRALGSAVAAHRLRCASGCAIFLDRDQTHVLCIGKWILYHWTTREVQLLIFFN